jgi:indolepyruvate ferredoxin oxidoreductase beta subunit
METASVLLAGVGGQGSLLASKILGNVLLSLGFDVKVSEVHGMAQRGGAVVTYVKYGERVFSPVTDKGEADTLIAFEPLEAARWAAFLKPGASAVMSTGSIAPMSVITGAATYPCDIPQKLRDLGFGVTAIDAAAAAEQAGNPKTSNIAVLGAAAAKFNFPDEAWQTAIDACVPPKFREVNQRAFEIGKHWANGVYNG